MGRARAAASDTAPRIPAHPTMITFRAGGRGSLCAMAGHSRGRYVAGKTQMNRATMTARLTHDSLEQQVVERVSIPNLLPQAR